MRTIRSIFVTSIELAVARPTRRSFGHTQSVRKKRFQTSSRLPSIQNETMMARSVTGASSPSVSSKIASRVGGIKGDRGTDISAGLSSEGRPGPDTVWYPGYACIWLSFESISVGPRTLMIPYRGRPVLSLYSVSRKCCLRNSCSNKTGSLSIAQACILASKFSSFEIVAIDPRDDGSESTPDRCRARMKSMTKMQRRHTPRIPSMTRSNGTSITQTGSHGTHMLPA